MNLDDYSYEENGRRYINPQIALDETNAFIDNFRSTQQAANDEITAQTRALGTIVPSNLGGLTGSGGYFRSRYQTPQINKIVSDLRQAAQLQALTDAINNEIGKAKKRYSDAYRAAEKRADNAGDKSDVIANKAIPIDTNTNNDTPTEIDIEQDEVTEDDRAYIDGEDVIIRDKDGNEWIDISGQNNAAANQADGFSLSQMARNAVDGQHVTVNGRDYVWVKNAQYPNGTWLRVKAR